MPPLLLPAPCDKEESLCQAREFIATLFKGGEYFELVTTTMQGKNGREIPLRRKENLMKVPQCEEEFSSFQEQLSRQYDSCEKGAWITFNPVRGQIEGKAVSDQDITEYRYVLIEADDLGREEQWKRLNDLNLPIETVVWSGGKSYHALVKVDAGQDKALYGKRVKLLYNYLEIKKFKVDAANKNPSRLTRMPGFMRNGEQQYLAAYYSGPATWQEFEEKYLAALSISDRRSITSAVNGVLGGRPQINVTDYADAFLRSCTDEENHALVHFYNGSWWQYRNGSWEETKEEELKMELTGFLQNSKVQDIGRISNAVISDTLANLKSNNFAGLPAHTYTMPCFLEEGKDGKDYMLFANGLLNIRELSEKKQAELIRSTPDFFCDKKVDYSYDPAADCPMWNEYLLTTFEDPEMRETLRSMF